MKTLLQTQIYVVEPGTEVGRDHEGNPLIVTDENAVCSGLDMWVTEKVYQQLKARSTPDTGRKPSPLQDFVTIKENPL